MVSQRIKWGLKCGIGSLLEPAGDEISFIRTREAQLPSCDDSKSQSASCQIMSSRYRIYAKMQAPWAIPHETAKTADVAVLAPQIANLNKY
jgi:hypothetical protein